MPPPAVTTKSPAPGAMLIAASIVTSLSALNVSEALFALLLVMGALTVMLPA
jgi:hypothetical protein